MEYLEVLEGSGKKNEKGEQICIRMQQTTLGETVDSIKGNKSVYKLTTLHFHSYHEMWALGGH
jgi:carbonic anhydrase